MTSKQNVSKVSKCNKNMIPVTLQTSKNFSMDPKRIVELRSYDAENKKVRAKKRKKREYSSWERF